ncbi:MAG TPA: ROK family protein [Gemmatimonadaceae bacterium]|nr:ROK family protein [Gemmatimonadaceae bacterium]
MRVAGAVDIGGTRTKIGLVTEDAQIVKRVTISTTDRGDPQPLVDGIVAALSPLLDEARANNSEIAGLGVSVAGFLDKQRSAMVANANLPALCGFPLRDVLEQRLNLPCSLEVDSNAATIGEFRHGAGAGSRRLLGATVGTGLGGGVIIDGAMLRYMGECAGDLGHIIVAPNGRECTCGARGCLEAMVCSAALVQRARKRAVREIVSAAQRGDKRARTAINETARWLGIGLASLTPLFHPDRIVIGGGVSASGSLLMRPLRKAYAAHVAPEFHDVEIVSSSLHGWEGMVGAASIVFQPMP